MALLDTGSIPEVGSSKNTTLDPPKIAIANESFLLLPPESVFTILPFSPSRAHFFFLLLKCKKI